MLFLVLVIAGSLLLINFKSYDDNREKYKPIPLIPSVLVGSILGFVSGVVGIGGGIFLSPILFNKRQKNQSNYYNSFIIYINQLNFWNIGTTY